MVTFDILYKVQIATEAAHPARSVPLLRLIPLWTRSPWQAKELLQVDAEQFRPWLVANPLKGDLRADPL